MPLVLSTRASTFQIPGIWYQVPGIILTAMDNGGAGDIARSVIEVLGLALKRVPMTPDRQSGVSVHRGRNYFFYPEGAGSIYILQGVSVKRLTHLFISGKLM